MAAAVAHNIGQIAVAIVVTGTPAIAFYLPVLLVAGVAAGFFTGTVAQAVLERLPRTRATVGRMQRNAGPTESAACEPPAECRRRA